MVKKTKGYKCRTRKLFSKKPRERGLPPLGYLLREYKIGEKVNIVINPSVHKGQPHKRYHGKTGSIIGRRGQAYLISLKEGNKEKIIISRPEHLKMNV
ncbi:MAG: 50S ribosomal protein L21e [Candidatus Odinarchaeia archaeon]